MKIRQLTGFTSQLLKGRQTMAFLVCAMPLGASFLFRFAETTVYSLFLYYTGMKPVGLFLGYSIFQQMISLVFTIVRLTAVSPLVYFTAMWLAQLCDDQCERKSANARTLLSPGLFSRSFCGAVLSKLIALMALIPAVVFGYFTFRLISDAVSGLRDFNLIMTVHAVTLTLFSLYMWLSTKLTLTALPFLLVKFPRLSVARVIRYCFVFMKKRKGALIKIFLSYIPLMLPVVTAPVAVTRLFTAVSLYFTISLREDEYLEKNRIYSNIGKIDDSAVLPSGTKRRFKKTADQT